MELVITYLEAVIKLLEQDETQSSIEVLNLLLQLLKNPYEARGTIHNINLILSNHFQTKI